MDGVTIRPINREAVVLALRDVYDRQPRVFRLTSGQRRAIARVGTSGRARDQLSDGSGG